MDRLLYVAATRARQRLHLVGHVSVDDAGQAKAPPAASLLGRLWPWLTPPEPPAREGEPRAKPTTARNGRAILRRISAAGLAQLAGRAEPSFSPGFSAGARDGWGDAAEHPAWQLEAGYDAAIGTLAHAWLERIGRDGIAAWPATALASRLSAMRRQLTRAIPPVRPTRPPKPCWKRCRPPCPTRAANGCCPNPARAENGR